MVYVIAKAEKFTEPKVTPCSIIHGRTISLGGIRGSSFKDGTLVRCAK
jgi:hypothetical protein